jgi:ornithine cyclodeaminase
MRVLKASDVEALLPMEICIELMAGAMQRVSEGRVVLPLRQFMPIPGTTGRLGLMPGYLAEPECFGLKIVSKFDRAAGSIHGSHVGAVMLFDAQEGVPLALLEGGTLTAIRTAATSALATRILARADAKTLLVCGTGEEAWRHIQALRHVRPFDRVLIWGRSAARVDALVSRARQTLDCDCTRSPDLAVALRSADVVCTTTSATEPYLAGRWLPEGIHLNLVGSAVAQFAEVDGEAVRRSRFYVDFRVAALQQAGELLAAIRCGVVDATHIVGEIGEVLLGTVPGRRTAEEITLYKSLGVAAQDLAAAHYLYQHAEATGAGVQLELGG